MPLGFTITGHYETEFFGNHLCCQKGFFRSGNGKVGKCLLYK